MVWSVGPLESASALMLLLEIVVEYKDYRETSSGEGRVHFSARDG